MTLHEANYRIPHFSLFLRQKVRRNTSTMTSLCHLVDTSEARKIFLYHRGVFQFGNWSTC